MKQNKKEEQEQEEEEEKKVRVDKWVGTMTIQSQQLKRVRNKESVRVCVCGGRRGRASESAKQATHSCSVWPWATTCGREGGACMHAWKKRPWNYFPPVASCEGRVD